MAQTWSSQSQSRRGSVGVRSGGYQNKMVGEVGETIGSGVSAERGQKARHAGLLGWESPYLKVKRAILRLETSPVLSGWPRTDRGRTSARTCELCDGHCKYTAEYQRRSQQGICALAGRARAQ